MKKALFEKPKDFRTSDSRTIANVANSPIGLFAFDEKGELISYKFYEKDVNKIAEAVSEINKEFLDELHANGYSPSTKGAKFLIPKLREFAIDLDFVKNNQEFNEFMSEFGIAWTRTKMKGSIARDKLVIQASNALEDITKTLNLFIERVREWFTLHYPECKLSDTELIKSIAKYGNRENFPNFKDSTGADLTEEDEEILKEYANTVGIINAQKKNLEKYIKSTMRDIAPNTSSIIDPLLSARMLSLAGSLEKFAKMTSSTIQLLGSEKALFRHLKNRNNRPPKYGLIFYDKNIQNAPEEKRGKIARIISAKLMIAGKTDFYSRRDDSKKLVQSLKDDIERVMKQ